MPTNKHKGHNKIEPVSEPPKLGYQVLETRQAESDIIVIGVTNLHK